jgi:hypothetical protein
MRCRGRPQVLEFLPQGNDFALKRIDSSLLLALVLPIAFTKVRKVLTPTREPTS